MSKPTVYVCRVETPEGEKDYVTLLTPEQFFSRGLASEAIVGGLSRPLAAGEPITPEVFARNPVFVEFLHAVIARRGPSLPGLIAEAERQGEGWVYLIDQRTRTPGGRVPPEDIIGAFEARGGRSSPARTRPAQGTGSYHPTASSGSPDLQAALMEELANLA